MASSYPVGEQSTMMIITSHQRKKPQSVKDNERAEKRKATMVIIEPQEECSIAPKTMRILRRMSLVKSHCSRVIFSWEKPGLK